MRLNATPQLKGTGESAQTKLVNEMPPRSNSRDKQPVSVLVDPAEAQSGGAFYTKIKKVELLVQ